MYGRAKELYAATLDEIRSAGLEKRERQLLGPQGASIRVRERSAAGAQLLRQQLPRPLARTRACSRPPSRRARRDGFGLSSVRFICGTQDAAQGARGARSPRFFGTDDAILYSSCFDANGGLFETLLGERGRHHLATRSTTPRSSTASACARPSATATRNGDMAALEDALRKTQDKRAAPDRHRRRLLDGRRPGARSTRICDLADKYRAHGDGRRLPRHRLHRQDRPRHPRALRRASSASTSSPRPWARPWAAPPAASPPAGRRSSTCSASARAPTSSPTPWRPPSSAPASPSSTCSSATATLRDKRACETPRRFREAMTAAGFDIKPGIHPIVPIMLSGPRRRRR